MSLSPEKKRLAKYLALNTVMMVALYFLLQKIGFPIHYVYVGLGGVLGLYYVIYNRGFAGKDATPDMLPSTMTYEEKLDFIEKSKQRMRKSQWVLTLLLPIIVALMLDMLYLFLWPQLEQMLL